MANNLSAYLEEQWLGTLCGSSFTSPTTVWATLATSVDDDGDSFTEIQTNQGLTRVPIQLTAPTTATSGTGFSTQNNTAVVFTAASTDLPNNVTHVGIYDAEDMFTGNLLAWAPLSTSRNVQNGTQVSFSAGSLLIILD